MGIKEKPRRGYRSTSPVDQAAAVLQFEPSAKAARSWLIARAHEQRHTGNPDCQGRALRLNALAHDEVYCLAVAELQRATTALVNRRRELIGEGTT